MPKERPSTTNFRFTPADRELLDYLTKALNLTNIGVIRLALRTLARRRFAQETPES